MAKQLTQKSVREFWQGVVDENTIAMRDALLEAINAEKEGRYGECSHCNRAVHIRFPDTRARTDAVKALHSLAGEMPKQDGGSSAGGAGFILKRVLHMPDGSEQTLDETLQVAVPTLPDE